MSHKQGIVKGCQGRTPRGRVGLSATEARFCAIYTLKNNNSKGKNKTRKRKCVNREQQRPTLLLCRGWGGGREGEGECQCPQGQGPCSSICGAIVSGLYEVGRNPVRIIASMEKGEWTHEGNPTGMLHQLRHTRSRIGRDPSPK